MAEASRPLSAGDTPKEKKSPLHVKELGLTQIDGHSKDHSFIADVVFVHGLQGHPQRTWQSKSPAKLRTHLRERLKAFILSGQSSRKRETHGDDGLFWPAEILPRDFNDVRIMTYGYDSRVTKAFKGPTSKSGIFQHGKSLLGALSRARFECGDRPIILVAHSLGYVSFEALLQSLFLIGAHTQKPRISPYISGPAP